jgi:hypothetical protein
MKTGALAIDAVVRRDHIEIALSLPGIADPLYQITIDPKKTEGRVPVKRLARVIEITDCLIETIANDTHDGSNLLAQALAFWLLRIQQRFFPYRRQRYKPNGKELNPPVQGELPLRDDHQCEYFHDVFPNADGINPVNACAAEAVVDFGCEIVDRLPAFSCLNFVLPSDTKWRGWRGHVDRLLTIADPQFPLRSQYQKLGTSSDHMLQVFCNPAIDWVRCALRSLDVGNLTKEECRAAVNAAIGAQGKTSTVYARAIACNVPIRPIGPRTVQEKQRL